MEINVVFYHPKNPQNLHDVAALAASLRANLYVIPRPGVDYKLEMLQYRARTRLKIVQSMAEAVNSIGDAVYTVLETYGDRYLHEIEIDGDKVAVIIGAEDYGVPRHVLDSLEKPIVVAKIPTAVQGMSYNVAASLAMALYEVVRRFRAGTP
ncbi:TrmH family RNA methyltransferase [Pyrodictium abyssi]|uniref:tRNA/rRNA methyltransferase SpoU type domain-containing protein n=1 Tax=Pyrodictium abyssi TaxID=54256 RepID=A0ABM8IZE5_9CREN|nr:hypothetical protein PABY_16000 [Pyrodictium abyssi]